MVQKKFDSPADAVAYAAVANARLAAANADVRADAAPLRSPDTDDSP